MSAAGGQGASRELKRGKKREPVFPRGTDDVESGAARRNSCDTTKGRRGLRSSRGRECNKRMTHNVGVRDRSPVKEVRISRTMGRREGCSTNNNVIEKAQPDRRQHITETADLEYMSN